MDVRFPAAPALLISRGREPAVGNFAGVPGELGLENIDYRKLRRPPWTWSRGLGRRLLKRWQFVGAVDQDLVVGAAVAHVQYLATAFAYVYDRRTGEIVERSIKAPLAAGAVFSRTPAEGETRLSLRGATVAMGNTPDDGVRTLDVRMRGDLEIHLRYREEGTGMSTACPHETGGLHYTYKFAGLPVEGEVIVGGRRRTLGPDALALLDWTASTPPRITTWNWTCAVGQDAAGRRVAINFSRGLVGGPFSQNAVWLEGEPHLLPAVAFGYDPEQIVTAPWHLTTSNRTVDLIFHPAAERFEDINLGLVASRLHQPFGSFEGTIDAGRERLDVSLFGFCEEHYAKW
jgi:hypothetical protein